MGVACANTPIDCDDGDPWIVDGCDPTSGCTHTYDAIGDDIVCPALLTDAQAEEACAGFAGLATSTPETFPAFVQAMAARPATGSTRPSSRSATSPSPSTCGRAYNNAACIEGKHCESTRPFICSAP